MYEDILEQLRVYPFRYSQGRMVGTDSLARCLGYSDADIPLEPTWREQLDRALKEEINAVYEGVMVIRDVSGVVFWFKCCARNERIGLTGFLMDVTAQKQLNSAVVQQSGMQAIGQLYAGVAHEVGNQLTCLSGALSQLRRSEISQEDRLHLVEVAKGAVNRSAQLMGSVTGLARQKANVPDLVNIHALVRSSVDLLTCAAHAKVTIGTQLDAEEHLIMGSEAALERVLLNFGLNAIAASSKGQAISISSWNEGRWICISVRDQGKGMDEDQKLHLFDLFYTTKQEENGTGIGLALCRQIVTDHGGIIRVESAPGQGSEFIIRLPIIEDEEEF